MIAFAYLSLCAAVIVLGVLMVRMERRIDEAREDICDIGNDVAAVVNSLPTIKEALGVICESLAMGVKTRDKLSLMLYVYRVELLFYDGMTAVKNIVTHDSIGRDDEIEILCDESEAAPGLCVTADDGTLCLHPRHGYTELTIPVHDDIDLFRDRLLSDGWNITSPEAEEEDDDVLPDKTESVCQGQ